MHPLSIPPQPLTHASPTVVAQNETESNHMLLHGMLTIAEMIT